MNMRPVSAVSAVQAGLQTADGDDTGIWRTPFSEMEPHRGGVELAHVNHLKQQHSHIYYKEVSSWKE